MRITSILLTIAISITVFGCAGTPAIDTSKPIDPDRVITLVEERNAVLQAMEGYGKLSVDSPEFSNSGSVALTILKPDSMQLEISGPFGVTLARAMVTRTDFVFYNGWENTVAEGETTVRNLRKVLRLALGFSDILDIMTGTFGFGLAPDGIPPVTALDGSEYTLTWRDGEETLEYVVDLDYIAVQHFTRRVGGIVQEEITFRDFRKKSGFHLPQVITISRPSNNESFSLVYSSQSINDLPIKFTFSYPNSARRISF